MKRILIAGASRGIGREFVRQCRADGWTVHATARDAAGCAALAEHCDAVHRLDITDDESIAMLAGELAGIPFDAILANAGISGDQALPVENIGFEKWPGCSTPMLLVRCG